MAEAGLELEILLPQPPGSLGLQDHVAAPSLKAVLFGKKTKGI